MDRPKKVNAALLFLHGFHDDVSYEGWLEVVEDYMKSLETKAQCLDEIIAYKEKRMKKLLVIVDMQNDFITGSLANPDAEKIVPGIVELIKNWDGDIAFTMDIHASDYLNIQEGKRLPIEHCICGTKGFKLVKDIQDALEAFDELPETNLYSFWKETFGSSKLGDHIEDLNYDEIYFCGTCTDICVISNAIICKAFDPEARIIVLKDLCAGTTPENHQKALDIMKQCQIDVL